MNTSPLRALASRPPVIESNRPPPMSPRTNRASVPPMATAATQPALPRSPAPPSGGRSLDPQVPPLSASLELDLEALERAAEQSQAPVYKQIRDLPPPPSALLKPSPSRNPQLGNTSYRSVTPQATQILSERAEAERPRPKAAEPPASNRGKYAPSRPASIFGASRPSEGSSIFGEDMISEKSLDEVILSYLAEDLEGGAKK